MRYLITMPDHEPFETDWFTIDNCFSPTMIVFDLHLRMYFDDTCEDGKWKIIKEDHL